MPDTPEPRRTDTGEKPVPDLVPDIVEKVLELIPSLEDPDFEYTEVFVQEGYLPVHVYSEHIYNLVMPLWNSKITYDFNWPAWQDEAVRYYEDPALVETADLDTVRKLLTTHVRKDRFCDGHLGAMLEQGHLTAILRRLEVLLTLPYLPPGRNIRFVHDRHQFIQAAREAADELSLDPEHPTGAVVVRDGVVLGRGANGSEYHRTHGCARKEHGSATGKDYELCEGCNPRHHAEQSAVRDVLERDEDPRGADLYLWGHWWCCQPCWDCMIEHGIENVYLTRHARRQFGERS